MQPFELRKSDIQGRGAFATRLIRRGQRVIEYTGERIDDDEADRRYDDDKMKRHHTFLFVVDDKTIVDGAVGGNDSRVINHSCDPNCEAVIEGKRIFIYALRTIRPGEELAYDYQYERTKDHTDEDEDFYACHCGADNCRGTILAPPKVPRKKRAKRGAVKNGAVKNGAMNNRAMKNGDVKQGGAPPRGVAKRGSWNGRTTNAGASKGGAKRSATAHRTSVGASSRTRSR